MSLKSTKSVISGPLVQIPNRRYRYPRGYRYPKPWYRYPLSRIADLAGKTSPTAPNKFQRSKTHLGP
ncbi:hypothetical protein GQ457_02G030590 [Hibiscus cannabinus]